MPSRKPARTSRQGQACLIHRISLSPQTEPNLTGWVPDCLHFKPAASLHFWSHTLHTTHAHHTHTILRIQPSFLPMFLPLPRHLSSRHLIIHAVFSPFFFIFLSRASAPETLQVRLSSRSPYGTVPQHGGRGTRTERSMYIYGVTRSLYLVSLTHTSSTYALPLFISSRQLTLKRGHISCSSKQVVPSSSY